MIDQWLNKLDNLNTTNLFWMIVASSILLAAWMQYIQHGWINPDSVLYFEQAKLFAQGEWKAGFKIFEWPFYGGCISLVHKITSLPVQNSAQLLNMIFFGIATASFLNLIKIAGGNNRTLFFGMLLLFGSLYIVGDVLEMLMRDEGFWAFYLTALLYFIHYMKSGNLSHAVIWQLSMIVATLFRIEGILFLIFLPIIVIACQPVDKKSKLALLLNTYSISIIIGLSIAMTIILYPEINIASFGRLDEVFTTNLLDEFSNKFFTQADIMSKQVLGEYLEEFAIPSLLLTFLYVMGSKILTATGVVGTALSIFGINNSSNTMPLIVRRVLLISSTIAFIVMFLIIAKVFILSSRYVVALAWILLIFASLYLSHLSIISKKKQRILLIVITVFLSLSIIKNILPKREGYNYTQEAVQWLKEQNKNGENVFYNDTRMIYYADAPYKGNWSDNWLMTLDAIRNKSIQNHHYLALTHSKNHLEHLKYIENNLPEYIEIKRFYNYRAEKFVIIYRARSF
jgi:hypothetical protein